MGRFVPLPTAWFVTFLLGAVLTKDFVVPQMAFENLTAVDAWRRLWAMMKAENKIVVPTLAHRSDRAIEVRRKAGSSEFVLNKMKKIQPYTKETFQKFHQAGIKIALGTDTQIDPEMGTSAHELKIYVDYGMTPMEAIQTGTRNAAEAIGLDREIGTLEPGKLADMVILSDNPLKVPAEAIKDLSVLMTMVGGKVEYCADGSEELCPQM